MKSRRRVSETWPSELDDAFAVPARVSSSTHHSVHVSGLEFTSPAVSSFCGGASTAAARTRRGVEKGRTGESERVDSEGGNLSPHRRVPAPIPRPLRGDAPCASCATSLSSVAKKGRGAEEGCGGHSAGVRRWNVAGRLGPKRGGGRVAAAEGSHFAPRVRACARFSRRATAPVRFKPNRRTAIIPSRN